MVQVKAMHASLKGENIQKATFYWNPMYKKQYIKKDKQINQKLLQVHLSLEKKRRVT